MQLQADAEHQHVCSCKTHWYGTHPFDSHLAYRVVLQIRTSPSHPGYVTRPAAAGMVMHCPPAGVS